MTGYLKNGYAKKLSKKEVDEVSRRTWYLPHHHVFNENKPNKMRTVFDTAGEYDGMSLNKALLTGPDLLNNLVGVLLRFRNHKFAIAADIEAMYHQVRVSKSDANALTLHEKPYFLCSNVLEKRQSFQKNYTGV